MDDETINKNIKAFFGELKNKTNLILFILIFVFIGLIIAMFVTKSIHDSKPHVPDNTGTSSTPTSEPSNPDDEEWPDDSAKTRIYNDKLASDLTNALIGVIDYTGRNRRAPYDDDTWKRAYRDYIRKDQVLEHTYKFCDMKKGGCRMPNQLTWKDDKLVYYFATHATCDHFNKTIIYNDDANSVAVYIHLRGETNGTACQNN